MAKQIAKLPPFLEAKVRIWYRIHNKKRNGFMTIGDFQELSDGFISEYNIDETTASEVRAWLVDGWSALLNYSKSPEREKAFLTTGSTPNMIDVAEKLTQGDKITEDMCVSAYNEMLQIDSEMSHTCFCELMGLFFNIFDTDADGFITSEDMVRGLRCFGFDKSDVVKAAFVDMDKSGDDKIDRTTYIAAWLEFIAGFNENAAMAKHFTVEIL